MFLRDDFDICDEDTAPDYNAEWRAAMWEAYDNGKATRAEVASEEERARYSQHLTRQR